MKTLFARNVGLLIAACALWIIGSTPNISFAQIIFRRWCDPCVPCPHAPSTGTAPQPGTPAQGTAGQPDTTASGGAPAPSGAAAEAASSTAPSPSDLFAQSGAGFASGPESYAPNMVGDYLGGLVSVATGSGSFTQVPLPGGAIPRFKMAENTSPLPQDRVYLNYDLYSNVPINNPPISVNALTPGFEKTLFGGVMSVELRLPMATTLDNTIFLDGSTRTSEGQVGNLGIAVKALLLQSDTFAVSGGLAITCPTARDTLIFGSQGSRTALQVLNQSVHLLPFVGGLWTPNDRLFCLGFMQLDADANGDPVNSVAFIQGQEFTSSIGRYNEQTMLYLDGAVGYWIRRNDAPDRRLNGIAVFGELHGNQSLNTSALNAPQSSLPLLAGNSISILDMTVGADFQFGKLTTLTTAYCTPLTAQREFDGQFRFMFNRRF
jgi:hypothetical protein